MSLEPGWYRFSKGARSHRLERPDAHNAQSYHSACGFVMRVEFVIRDHSIQKCTDCTREIIAAEGERAIID